MGSPHWHWPVARLHVSGSWHELGVGVQWHPTVPLMLPHAGVSPLHVRQVVPLPPQSPSEVPAAQVWPLVQHPVEQLPQTSIPPHPLGMLPHCPTEHVVIGVHPQTPAVPPPPHVSGEVQSVFVAHPHVPPVRQAVPEALAAHEVHVTPVMPQAVGLEPSTHVAPLQQPP